MFEINGIKWNIEFVPVTSPFLTRSDGSQSVGVTDANTSTVYLSNRLKGAFLRRVTAHELCHCFCFSYDIHMPIEQEEYMADWISLYGSDLVYLLDDILLQLIMKSNALGRCLMKFYISDSDCLSSFNF